MLNYSNNIGNQDLKFQQILQAEGYSLSNFQSQSPQIIFPNAINQPQFFKTNLVSPHRILKQFLNNEQANIKFFYFQLLRVSFEVWRQNGLNKKFLQNLKKIVFHPNFQIMFTHESQSQVNIYNDFQFKKLFAETIQLFESQQQPCNVEEILNHFPIIDMVFIHIIRTILANQGINVEFNEYIPTESVIGISELLQLSVIAFQSCWKFQDSDMYLYEQNQNEIYLAYLVENTVFSQHSSQGNIEQYSSKIDTFQISSSTHQKPVNYNNYDKLNIKVQQSQFIQKPEDFVTNSFQNDYEIYQKSPDLNFNIGESLGKDKPKNYLHESSYSQFNKNNDYSQNYYTTTNTTSLETTFDYLLKLNKELESGTYTNLQYRQSYQPSNNFNIIDKPQIKSYQQTNLSYQWKPYVPQQSVKKNNLLNNYSTYQNEYNFQKKTISQVPNTTNIILKSPEFKIQSKLESTGNQSYVPRATSPLDLSESYKYFTDSFVLQKLTEPHRSTIKNLKNSIKNTRRGGISQGFQAQNMPPVVQQKMMDFNKKNNNVIGNQKNMNVNIKKIQNKEGKSSNQEITNISKVIRPNKINNFGQLNYY